MDKFLIEGGRPLNGVVTVSGSKNSCLPILAATLLVEGQIRLENVPDLMDVRTMKRVLETLGAKVEFLREQNTMIVDASSVSSVVAPYELVKTMRASFLVMGPLLARFGRAEVFLPPGFYIEEFATAPGARSMALATDGTLFVGTRDQGVVYAVQNGKTQKILSGRSMPNGVAFKDGDLFVAEVHQILILKDILNHLNQPVVDVFAKGLPKDNHHGWKFIRFGPDQNLYVPVGAPCNICEKPDPYATILKLDFNSRLFSVYARGIRNTVGFDWNPKDQSLWFSDNGRDWLGDDAPPEELNRADRTGLHFGYPYCHGNDILDPEFGRSRDCTDYTQPTLTLQAHTAGLGLRFYTGRAFPKKYHGGIFLAQHGSWNRSQKTGYQVMFITVEKERAVQVEVFASGWLGEKERVSGRPVDIENMPDGSILVSDDYSGKIYRIGYNHE